MALTFQFVYGSTTVDLTAGVYGISYVPQDPGGKEVVTESATVRVIASSLATQQAAIHNLNLVFEAAQRRRLTGIGNRVYVKFLEEGDTVTYRSEIWAAQPHEMPGKVTVMPVTMSKKIFDSFAAELQVIWTRRPYWENNAETELELSNNSQVAATGGCEILNPHTAEVFSDNTVSYDESDGQILDSGDGFGIFAAGDVISVRGSTSNDGVYTVVSVAGDDSYIVVNEPLTDEIAGDATKIYAIDNFVHIDSSEIGGTKLAATRIEMTNGDAGADLATVWISNNYLSEPEDFAHVLEAEDSDTGADTNDASCSSDEYRAYTVSTPEAKMTAWTIPTETLAATKSAYFKVMARFFDGTNLTDVKLRIKIFYGSQALYVGGQIEYDDTYAGISRLWRTIDTIQLPPYFLEGATATDITVELWGVRTSAGDKTINLDCLMLLPIDSYRKLRSLSGVAQNSVLIDDGIKGLYYQTVSGEYVKDVVAEGEPIMLWPAIDNRLYFIQHSETADTADRDRLITVKVFYRERRATL